MKRKPVICMVSDHGCIRVFKESKALKEKGYTVYGMATNDMFGSNIFDTFAIYLDEETLTNAVRTFDKAGTDIFHVHNEPDWMVSVVRQATDKPIIFDVHDLDSMRYVTDTPSKDEASAFLDADAFVHVSKPCRDWAEKVHGKDKPSIILHPWVNREFIPKQFGEPCWTSLVYQGGLSSNGSVQIRDPDGRTTFNMRYFAPMVESFVNQGFTVSLYSQNVLQDFVYENLGGAVHKPLPYPTLLRALRMYGFGFVGACVSAPLMEAAMPNKLFDYLSQGVVPVILFASQAAKFVESQELGIVLQDFNGLREKLKRGPAIKQNIVKYIQEAPFSMEQRIAPLEALYQELML